MAVVYLQAYSVLSDPVQRQAHDAGDAHEHAGFSRTNADDLFAEFFNGGDPFAEVSVLLDNLTQPQTLLRDTGCRTAACVFEAVSQKYVC